MKDLIKFFFMIALLFIVSGVFAFGMYMYGSSQSDQLRAKCTEIVDQKASDAGWESISAEDKEAVIQKCIDENATGENWTVEEEATTVPASEDNTQDK